MQTFDTFHCCFGDLHRAPLPWEFEWTLALDDTGSGPDVYYVRVRQKNDQWAWSSPVFLP